MIPTIVKSRMQLREFSFIKHPEDNYDIFFITPPIVYPDLFSLQFPNIVAKSRHEQWTLAKHGKSSFLSFCSDVLSDREIEIIKQWIERYKQYVLLGCNSYIGTVFSNELDFCLALDYTYDKSIEKRTIYGEVEYQLKYRNNIQCLDILSDGLSRVLIELSKMFDIHDSIISIVPSSIKPCCIPRKLAKLVADTTKVPFIDNILYCNKKNLKNLAITDKVKEWERLYSCSNCISFDGDVREKTVFLIDDLYQSGITLWSSAKYLKQIGATAVIGLVCVKSLRDSDNQ
jgi:predicted amidophosphoribosyltransferase